MHNSNGFEFRSKWLSCALFTMFPHEKIFRHAPNKSTLTSQYDTSSYNLIHFHQFLYLKDPLNKTLIRHFACRLLYTLVENDKLIFPISQSQSTRQYKETLLLKKYFKKFRFNYYRYYYSPLSSNKKSQIRKLNLIAFTMLLLLAGI